MKASRLRPATANLLLFIAFCLAAGAVAVILGSPSLFSPFLSCALFMAALVVAEPAVMFYLDGARYWRTRENETEVPLVFTSNADQP